MSHKISDVLSSARLVLPILRETVLDDGATWVTVRGPARREGQPCSPPGHPRSGAGAQFRPCADAAVRGLLHVMDPMAWRRPVGSALPGGEHEAGPLAELLTLQHLLHLVIDDHDLSPNPRVPHPALVRQDAPPFQAPTVTPMSLLDANGPIVAHVPTP